MPEKKWVFDTVALSNFLLSDSDFILADRYLKCGLITWQVYDELSSGIMEYPDLKKVEKLIKDGILELVSLAPEEHRYYLQLIAHLGKGEASCIAVAKIQNTIVVADDRTARKQCSMMKIPFTGTLGILKASVLGENLELAEADEILKRMIAAGFYSPIRSLADIL